MVNAKRKIFSVLVVLVLICMPLLCFTGCQSGADQDVVFTVSGTGSVAQNGSLTSVSGLTITINYTLQKWNSETDQYEYVQEDSSEDSGYKFVGTNFAYYYATNKTVTISEALTEGMTVRGFSSSKTGDYKMTMSFGGKSIDVSYTVTAA